MAPDETSTTRPSSPKAEPVATPSEGELSRIAREAVHQPADPRLDRQLARLGVSEASESTADAGPGQPDRGLVVAVTELAHLESRLRRTEVILGVLAVAVVILAIAVASLLLR